MIAHYDHKRKRDPHYLTEHVEEMLDFLSSYHLPTEITEIAKVCIKLHDVGKKSDVFQTYIKNPTGKRGSVRHAIGGAYALHQKINSLPSLNQQLAFFSGLIIAGHHSKILDYGKDLLDRYDNLPKELKGIEVLAEREVNEALQLLQNIPVDKFQGLLQGSEESFIYLATLTRFAMSAMIDADWLSTEAYFSEEKAEKRKYNTPSFQSLQTKLDQFYEENEFPDATEPLNRIKVDLQQQARALGKQKHSFHTLHAPTGSGKTLTGLEFAVSHAIQHEKRRVIVALPLMNLTEEMSALYRDIFGDNHVIEDHSTAFVDRDNEETSISLATNNWNRPFVVTTTNQLMESLFHNRPMKIRKLHRLYGSVIILDEYHKLPLHVLRPILKQLDILQKYFDVTVLLMSATPFALTESKIIKNLNLINKPKELINREEIFSQVPKRIRYKWLREKETIQSLTEKIAESSTVLSIVNTRKEAQQLFCALKGTSHSFEQIYHLSTTMCSTHRSNILERIHRDLKMKKSIAVVSTSVLEAGIDISFPVVYRMLAPIDAIAQAAGRCNRYGELESGLVVLFELDQPVKTEIAYKQGIDLTRELLVKEGEVGLENQDIFIRHYKQAFSGNPDNLDKYSIQEGKWLRFNEVAKEFKMIENVQVGVICTEFEGFQKEWLTEMKTRKWWQKVQPYMVSINLADGSMYKENNELRILTAPYDQEMGVIL